MFQLTRRSRVLYLNLSMFVFWANSVSRMSLQLETGEVISFDGES